MIPFSVLSQVEGSKRIFRMLGCEEAGTMDNIQNKIQNTGTWVSSKRMKLDTELQAVY
jgi:hypothetical protein